MILSWLLAAQTLGAVIAVGGSSVARLAAAVGVRSRWTALALMVCSIGLPIGLAIRSPAPATTARIAVARPASRLTVAAPSQQQLPPSHEVDLLLLAGWGALALGTGALFTASYRRLRADVAGLPRRELCGQVVALSDDLGPAAVGREVVLPAWVFELPLDEQRLVLRHECEHVRARDHAVLFGGIVLVILMPWNLGLWWQLRRLRIAVELDCDARVTPTPRDRPRYAELLLRSRDRAPARRMALAFASARSALAERLLALLDGGRPSVRRVTGWSLSTAACAVLITRVPVPELVPLISRPVVASTASGPSAGLPATAALVNPIGYTISQGKGTAKRSPVRAVAAGHVTAPVVNPTVNAAPGDSAVAASVPHVRYDSLVPYVPSAASVRRGFGGGRGTSFQQPEAVRATRDTSSIPGPGR